MNYKIFITNWSDTENILVRAENKKEAIEKLKKELDFEGMMLLGDGEEKTATRELIKDLHELKSEASVEFYKYYFIKKDIIYLPYFQASYKNGRALKALCEEIYRGKIVHQFEYDKVKKGLAEIEKVELYDDLKNELLKLVDRFEK